MNNTTQKSNRPLLGNKSSEKGPSSHSKRYIIRPDGLYWCIAEVGVTGQGAKNPGETYDRAIKWFSTLEKAIDRLLELVINEKWKTDASLLEIKEAVFQAKEEVISAIPDAIKAAGCSNLALPSTHGTRTKE